MINFKIMWYVFYSWFSPYQYIGHRCRQWLLKTMHEDRKVNQFVWHVMSSVTDRKQTDNAMTNLASVTLLVLAFQNMRNNFGVNLTTTVALGVVAVNMSGKRLWFIKYFTWRCDYILIRSFVVINKSRLPVPLLLGQ